MENKYYTPTIEEFHVGFEYYSKELTNESIWQLQSNHNAKLDYIFTKRIFEKYSILSTVEELILQDRIVVKYLDREDIESFGWSDFQHSVNDWYKFKKTVECPISHYTYQSLRLLHDIPSSGIRIIGYEYNHLMEQDKEGDNLFRGIIKNKSEFKKLMQQLAIN